jgi:hypothetical protein
MTAVTEIEDVEPIDTLIKPSVATDAEPKLDPDTVIMKEPLVGPLTGCRAVNVGGWYENEIDS